MSDSADAAPDRVDPPAEDASRRDRPWRRGPGVVSVDHPRHTSWLVGLGVLFAGLGVLLWGIGSVCDSMGHDGRDGRDGRDDGGGKGRMELRDGPMGMRGDPAGRYGAHGGGRFGFGLDGPRSPASPAPTAGPGGQAQPSAAPAPVPTAPAGRPAPAVAGR